LKVVKESSERKHGEVCWVCKCDCGNITTPIRSSSLTSGATKSCGCLHSERIKQKNFVHGVFVNPDKHFQRVYKNWTSMKQRCFNPKEKNYKNYGGRGITVCDEWKSDFQAFYDYVSKLPNFNKRGYSLDRINNDGNYEPNNVRWATQKEQINNSRIVLKRGN
jgi:hypothetical protein